MTQPKTKFRNEVEALAWAIAWGGLAGVDAYPNGRDGRATEGADKFLDAFRDRLPDAPARGELAEENPPPAEDAERGKGSKKAPELPAKSDDDGKAADAPQ